MTAAAVWCVGCGGTRPADEPPCTCLKDAAERDAAHVAGLPPAVREVIGLLEYVGFLRSTGAPYAVIRPDAVSGWVCAPASHGRAAFVAIRVGGNVST